MKLAVNFKETSQDFAVDFGEVHNISDGGFERGYAEGYDKGNADGYTKGRSSLDVLPTLEFEKIGAYYGKTLGSLGDQQLIVLVTLKKGKNVPTTGSFGHIYQSANGSTSAAWTVSNGKYNTNNASMQVTPNKYEWSMVGCYPPSQEKFDEFMDAFDVRVERICTEI